MAAHGLAVESATDESRRKAMFYVDAHGQTLPAQSIEDAHKVARNLSMYRGQATILCMRDGAVVVLAVYEAGHQV
jgi:hypothetical protein